MCGQVILRCLKLIRQEPEKFAKVLLANYKTIPVRFFAFTTFPALFQFFTGMESLEFAIGFVVELLTVGAPEDLVAPLFQSLLLATFPFTDALWSNFHRRVSSKSTMDDVAAISNLIASIEECAPLIPAKLIELMRRMFEHNLELSATAILQHIRITFELWHAHCPGGMSFGCGESFLEFLSASKDFKNGNSATIANCFHQCHSVVPAYPFSCELCDMSSESVVFSHGDFAAFRQAFDGAEPRPALFKAIEVNDRVSRFTPYVLDYFPNVDRRKIGFAHRLLFTCQNRTDTIFDPTLFSEVKSANHSIGDNQQRLADLEDYFRLAMNLRFVHDFQSSIRRYRNAAFSEFTRHQFKRTSIRPSQMEELARQILRQPREDRSLVVALLPELLRIASFPDLPQTFLTRFWDLRKAYLANAWPEVIQTAGVRYIIELVPEATRRQLTSFGEVFVLFSHLFASVRTIGDKHSYAPDEFAKLVKFVSLNSEFPGILKVFLVFDKFVLQHKFFMSTLDDKVLHDWNAFSRVMWSMLVQDQTLSQDVTQFVTAEMPA
jgi:hypothetical protein